MKHCILVKLIPEVTKKIQISFMEQLQELFDNCKEIEGIHGVKIFKSTTGRDDSADIMIELDMERGALEAFDKCETNFFWKKEYTRFIDTKLCFDYDSDKPFTKK